MYRQIARMSALNGSEAEVLDAGWGAGPVLELLVDEFGARATGVTQDPRLAEAVRVELVLEGYADRADCQEAPLHALPYRDGVFDLTIAGEQVAVSHNPAEVIAELARVTRPGGSLVLLQWVWRSPLAPEDRNLISEHLGVTPRSLVEWRQMLQEAHVVVDLADYRAETVPGVEPDAMSGPTLAATVPFRERLVLLRRALLRWGAEAVRGLLARDRLVRGILANNAGVGLCIVRGVRAPTSSTVRDAPVVGDMDLFVAPTVTGEPKAPPPAVVLEGPREGSEPHARAGTVALADGVAEIETVRETATDAVAETVPHVEVEDLPLFSMDPGPP